MPRRKTHTETWWAASAPHMIRCNGHNKSTGDRCRAEAAAGTTVCDRHGALIPHVQAAAARRVQTSVDEAAQFLIDAMNDADTDMRERVKIAHDLLDRGGLAATSKHVVGVVGSNDPLEELFLDLFSTPGAFEEPRQVAAPDPQFEQFNLQVTAEEYEDLIGPLDIVDAELVGPAPRALSAPRDSSRKANPAKPPKRLREDLERLDLL